MIRVSQLKMPLAHSREDLEQKLRRTLRICAGQLTSYQILKRSLDARRQEDIHYTYTVDVCITDENEYLKKNRDKNITRSTTVKYRAPKVLGVPAEKRPVICGSGPAGMFCAYFLAQAGFRPLVIERGGPVEKRSAAVEGFWAGAPLDAESNVQFGEGGAGTFSDGKLATMVKDSYGRIRRVLEIFVQAGAPEEILYQNKPHIGTDKLRTVVAAMREQIKAWGGEFSFGTKLVGLHCEKGRLVGIVCETGGKRLEIAAENLVLAIGHSARDTFEMLKEHGIYMEPKAFAVGVRVEHAQELINRIQYKAAADQLPAADYKLACTAGNGRGVYSFCMCPGGFVINASSEPGRLVVNGMSNYDRAGRNANSALIVTVTPKDFACVPGKERAPGGCAENAQNPLIQDPLAGIAFQRHFEALAYQTAGGKIPYQLYGDLLSGRASTGYGTVAPCHRGAAAPADLRGCLPGFVTETLLEGMKAFDRTLPGFAQEDAVFSGVEMRTSSPVRIVRNEQYESNIAGIYPCGEGAGYAGGITSAAVDGIKVFEAIAARFSPARQERGSKKPFARQN